MGLPPKLLAQGVTDMVRISDARMSGTAYGTVVLHVAPEARAGGPLAVVRDGDWIELDCAAGRLHLDISDAELQSRLAALGRARSRADPPTRPATASSTSSTCCRPTKAATSTSSSAAAAPPCRAFALTATKGGLMTVLHATTASSRSCRRPSPSPASSTWTARSAASTS